LKIVGGYMPEAFDKCVRAGGKVRTKSMSNGKYMHICFLGNKSYAGEIKSKGTGGNKYTTSLGGKQ
jgi:hypothetical protein